MKTKLTLEEKENLLYGFGDKLVSGEFEAILYNGQTPITSKDTGLLEYLIEVLTDEDRVKCNSKSSITIYTENETIKLKGCKRMSDGEIFARKYLTDECDGNIIIKDSLEQLDLREDNIKRIDDSFFKKCKDVINIRKVPKDSKHYNMNWDCLLVRFQNNPVEEIWQRA